MAHKSVDEVQAGAPNLQTCANPDCTAKFKKLGAGLLFAENVDNPLAWGLPLGQKQKVVWLCAECAKTFDLVFNASTRRVILLPRRALEKRVAA